MMKHNRERLLLRYLTALDAGDLETLTAILRLAESDAALALQLQELHAALETETEAATPAVLNGNHTQPDQNGVYQGAVIMQATIPVTIRPQSITLKTNRHLSAVLSLAAAVLTLLFMGMTLAIQPSIPGSQPATLPFMLANMQPITPDNVTDLQPQVTLGSGWINGFAWSPDSQTLALSTATGIYLHDAADLNAEPILFGGQAIRSSHVVYSQNGRVLAAIREGAIWLWDAETGTVLNRIVEPQLHGWLAIAADGGRVAALICEHENDYLYSLCDENYERVWDARTGEVIQNFAVPPRGYLASAVFNKDLTRMVYTGENARDLYLANVNSGEVALVAKEPLYSITTLAFSSDSTRLAVGYGATQSQDSRLKVLSVADLLANAVDTDDASDVSPISGFNEGQYFQSLTFRANDSEILASQYDGTYLIWRGNDEEIISQKPVPQEKGLVSIGAVGDPFSPDGQTIAVMYRNGWLKLHDLATGAEIDSLNSYDTHVTNIAFDRSGQLMATSGWTGGVNLWDLSQPIPAWREIVSGEVDDKQMNTTRSRLNADGTLLVYQLVSDTGHSTGVYVRDLATGETIRAMGGNDLARGYNATFDADNNLVFPLSLNRVIRWTAPDQLTEFEPMHQDGSQAFGGSGIAVVSPDGRWIARHYCDRGISSWTSQCNKATTGVWDAQTGEALLYLNTPTTLAGISADLAFSDDGQTLALTNCASIYRESISGGTVSGCASSYALVWDVSSLDAEEKLTPDASQPIEPIITLTPEQTEYWTVRLSPTRTGDLTLMALTTADGVEIWELDLVNETAVEVHHLKEVANIAQFDPTGRLLVVGNDGIVTLYGVTQ